MIENLNKVFESRVRLGIMSILMVNEWVEFKALKDLLKVTDGNLASHLSALEKKELLVVNKEFVGKKPRTTYNATKEGKTLFNKHLAALEVLINKEK
ncbi:transcriptional regulator [Aureispira sp. CCB-E]|uniref:winged helix-turn-helix domain-containing protein n=1 Tax=Aureispira sp. CCB-E TaxID=3051121 RepID=UPI002868F274|nr:transcriptional regulator [Aureispira sp. CCB-E]WMX12120.1 transcriptional regulator [Aureispira sp. CCB-E]